MFTGLLNQQLQAEIVEFCQSQKITGCSRRIVRFGQYAVKYGRVSPEEANNQQHAQALVDKNFGLVPKVHAYFTEAGVDYLVMDYIEGEVRATIEDEESLAAVARLVSHLHSFTSTTPGPVNGSNYSGPLWPEDEKTPPITSTTNLEGYINSRLLGARKISFSTTPLVFVHGDIAPRNIVFGPDGLWLLDWEFAGYFPRSVEFAGLYHDCAGDVTDSRFRDSLAVRLEISNQLTADEREQTELLLIYSLNCIRYSWNNTGIRSATTKKPRRPVSTTDPPEEYPWLNSISQAGLDPTADHCPPSQLQFEI